MTWPPSSIRELPWMSPCRIHIDTDSDSNSFVHSFVRSPECLNDCCCWLLSCTLLCGVWKRSNLLIIMISNPLSLSFYLRSLARSFVRLRIMKTHYQIACIEMWRRWRCNPWLTRLSIASEHQHAIRERETDKRASKQADAHRLILSVALRVLVLVCASFVTGE